MKKITLFYGLVLCMLCATTYIFSQATDAGTTNFTYDAIGDSCNGAGQLKYDDGTFENGYGWNPVIAEGRYVMKFTPTSYPWTITKLCVALTRTAAGADTFAFDIVVYDTTGAGGTPGTEIYALNNQPATGILIYPAYSWYNYTVAIPPLSGGSYYIGLRWNPQTAGLNNKYIMADQSATTTLAPGYSWATPGPWNPITTSFPTYRALGIRTQGSGASGGSGIQLSLCRNGLNIPLLDHTTIRDSIQFVSSSACIVTDVNFKLDTMIHTWDADIGSYLRHNGIGVKVINSVGGSGDNFIGTLLNDSAATLISAGTAPFTGSFKPSNPLTPFNGTTAAGYWTHVMTDTATQDSGTLKAWCVIITYTGCTGTQQTVEIPNYYSLSQNYPNPFNPSTTIKFTMPKGENVRLVVYDMLGREVKTLVNEFTSSGIHEVNFDASSLASGVYFYKLVTPNFTETKRMLLVK